MKNCLNKKFIIGLKIINIMMYLIAFISIILIFFKKAPIDEAIIFLLLANSLNNEIELSELKAKIKLLRKQENNE